MKKLMITLSLTLLVAACSSKTIPKTQPNTLPKVILDSDKDGVNDKTDQCANTPLNVVVDKNGCPLQRNMPSESSVEYRVHFDKNSTIIKPIYLQALQNVINNRLIMQGDVTANIIAGTSSDEGDFKSEKMQLSKQRALQLKNKFIQLTGIDPKNLIAIGCGDYNPIADEHSEKGRALNRRIYMQFGSDINNKNLVLNEFGQLKDEYKNCQIAN